MKDSFFYLCTMVLVLLACTKGDQIQSDLAESDSKIIWTIGAEHSSDTTVNVMHKDGQGFLSFDNYSICPNHELLITVVANDKVIYNQRVKDPNEKITLNPPVGQMISIETKLVLSDNLIDCIWLGQAIIRYEYQE